MKSKKKLVIVGAVVIIVCIATLYLITSKNNKNHTDSTASTANQSVATVINKISDYAGKEVSLKGQIIEQGTGTYYLLDTTAKSPTAIKLDFKASSLDPKKYVYTPAPGNAPSSVPKTAVASPRTTSPPEQQATPAQAAADKATSSRGVVTVSGKLVQNSSASQPILVIKSINN